MKLQRQYTEKFIEAQRAELRSIKIEYLIDVPADVYKWHCCIKDCKCFTRVKDYGTLPFVLWRRRWMNTIARIYFCGKHWKEHGVRARPMNFNKSMHKEWNTWIDTSRLPLKTNNTISLFVLEKKFDPTPKSIG